MYNLRSQAKKTNETLTVMVSSAVENDGRTVVISDVTKRPTDQVDEKGRKRENEENLTGKLSRKRRRLENGLKVPNYSIPSEILDLWVEKSQKALENVVIGESEEAEQEKSKQEGATTNQVINRKETAETTDKLNESADSIVILEEYTATSKVVNLQSNKDQRNTVSRVKKPAKTVIVTTPSDGIDPKPTPEATRKIWPSLISSPREFHGLRLKSSAFTDSKVTTTTDSDGRHGPPASTSASSATSFGSWTRSTVNFPTVTVSANGGLPASSVSASALPGLPFKNPGWQDKWMESKGSSSNAGPATSVSLAQRRRSTSESKAASSGKAIPNLAVSGSSKIFPSVLTYPVKAAIPHSNSSIAASKSAQPGFIDDVSSIPLPPGTPPRAATPAVNGSEPSSNSQFPTTAADVFVFKASLAALPPKIRHGTRWDNRPNYSTFITAGAAKFREKRQERKRRKEERRRKGEGGRTEEEIMSKPNRWTRWEPVEPSTKFSGAAAHHGSSASAHHAFQQTLPPFWARPPLLPHGPLLFPPPRFPPPQFPLQRQQSWPSTSQVASLHPKKGNGNGPVISHAPQPLRQIIIDGSNVAMDYGRHKLFDARGILICAKFFISQGHHVRVFVPQLREEHATGNSRFPTKNGHMLTWLHERDLLTYTPHRSCETDDAGRPCHRSITCYDDYFIVDYAHQVGGVIVSRDNYRDVSRRYPEWAPTINNRLLMYSWAGDIFMPARDPMGKNGPPLERFLRYEQGEKATLPSTSVDIALLVRKMDELLAK